MGDQEKLKLEPVDLEKLSDILFLIERLGMFEIKEPKLLRQIIEMN